MNKQHGESFDGLKLIARELTQLIFPELKRPPNPANDPPTPELVKWGATVYCFSWMRHLCALLNGVVALMASDNVPASRIVARSVYELGAHMYYVKKHLTQHVRILNWSAAWTFLTPIATGSRYMNKQIPAESELFPIPAHISKMINCFSEVMPANAQEDYSYLSEFSHPNVMAFLQHYEWSDPYTVKFVSSEVHGFLGATTSAVINGLLALDELLRLAGEQDVRSKLIGLLRTVAENAKSFDNEST